MKKQTGILLLVAGLVLAAASRCEAIAIRDVLAHFMDWYDQGCVMSPGAAGAPASGAVNAGGTDATCQMCSDSGMPRWWIDEPYINLHITDEPLAYTTSSGQHIGFKFIYKQRFCVPGTNEVPAAITNYYQRDYYAAMRTYRLTNAGWSHNWMRDITFWDTLWETNSGSPYQHGEPLFHDGYEALVFGGEGGVNYFYSNSLSHLGQTNLADGLSQKAFAPRPSAGYPRFTNSPAADANGIYWGTERLVGFEMRYPDGSKDIFGLAFSEYSLNPGAATNRTTAHALLTQKIDPQGRTNHLGYEKVAFPNTNTPSYHAYRLKYVVDTDGRTNTFHYDLTSPQHAWQVTEIDDAYGRQAFISYDATTGRLNGIKDAVTNSNSFQYDDSTGWVTNLTTPYGTTTFQHFQDPATPTNNLFSQRAAYVVLPNNSSHLFYYLHQATNGVPTSTTSPTNVPYAGNYEAGFDNGTGTNIFGTNYATSDYALTYRDSFHWNERQFQALSTSFTNYVATNFALALSSLQSADFKKGRMKHWLLGADLVTASQSVSCERDASPDPGGSIEGAWTWYRYANKTNGVEVEGDAQVTCVARLLPDGTTQYARYNYAAGTGLVTNNESTYSLANGTVGAFTNYFSYATNNIDLLSVSNSAGQYTLMGYNGVHQMTAVTNSLNEVTSMGWDTNTFNLLSVSYPSGGTIWLQYNYPAGPGNSLNNNSGMLQSVYNDATDLDLWIYDYTNGLPASFSTSAANTPTTDITNTWDGLNRLTGMSFQDGTTVSNVYNILDLAAHKDRVGNWTYYGYDQLEHLTQITNALTNVTTLSWCGCGALTGVSDALTNTTTFFYDNQGRLTSALYPDLSSVTYQMDLLGRVTNVFDGTSRYARMTYNNQGLVTTVSNAAGLVSKVVYDSLDRPQTVTDADNVTVTNTFDLLSRLVARSWPDGTNEGWGYATNGLIAYTNRDHQVTRYLRDAVGRALVVTNANHETTQFGYDGFNRIYSLTDGLGHTRSWEYNPWGWVQAERDQANNYIALYYYDVNGNLTNRWRSGFVTTEYAYDAVGNLTNIAYPGTVTPGVALAYNAVNWLTNLVDGVGTNTFAYTKSGQLTAESFGVGNAAVSNAYMEGARTSMSVGTLTTSYAYDAVWRLQTLTSPAGSFNYGYPASASTLVTGIGLPNGANIVNQYDGLARLTNTALQNYWGHVLDGYGYAYGRADFRTGITRSLGLTTNSAAAGYDNIGQLISWTASETGGAGRLNEQLGYGYDAAHNLTLRTNNALVQNFNVDAFDELTNVTRSGTLTVSGNTPAPATNVSVNGYAAALYGDLTFAATNFMLSNGTNTFTIKATNVYNFATTNVLNVNLPTNVALAYDTNGNLTGDGTRTFYYDAENRLTNVFVTNQWKTEFAYDGFGRRRIERDYTWTNSAWSRTNETRYIFDGLVPIQERDSNNAVLVTYTRGIDFSGGVNGAGGIGGLLARTDANGSTYYHSDGSGNVTTLMDGVQNIVARYEYDPYGRQIGQWGKMAGANTMRFSSMPAHTPSGLVGYHARFYEPGFQRWLNRDPIGEAGGVNLYGFVGNGPVNGVDAWGYAGTLTTLPDGSLRMDFKPFPTPRSPQERDPDNPFNTVGLQRGVDNAQSGSMIDWTPEWTGHRLPGDFTGFVLKEAGMDALDKGSYLVPGFGEEKALANGVRAVEKEAVQVFEKEGVAILEGASGFKNIQKCKEAAKEAERLHHAWPKYLGGPFKQKLEALPKSVHDAYHSGLDKFLPRAWGTEYYEGLSAAARADAYKKLTDYTRAFDAKYGTKLYDAMKEAGFPGP